MKHQMVKGSGSDQTGASASFWKNNLRDYGLLGSLLVIMRSEEHTSELQSQ